MKFTKLFGQVISTPVIAMESPFQLTFHAKVQGDVMPVVFTGDFARALQKQIRFGDFVNMNGFSDKGTLVVGFISLEKQTAAGRNIDVHA